MAILGKILTPSILSAARSDTKVSIVNSYAEAGNYPDWVFAQTS
jgi:hypothetical protein